MVNVVGTSPAYLFSIQSTSRSLAGRSASGGAGTQALPDELSSSRFAVHRVTVTKTQANSILFTSIFIATSITGIIGNLVESTKIAGSSLTNPSADIYVGSRTRLSVGNIQAGLDLTLAGIDKLVKRTAVGTANILSSTSSDITILTSVYGGKLNVAPQPFDVAGLGLQNLDLHTSEGRIDALNRLSQARLTAEKRVLNLKALRGGLSHPGDLSSALRTLGAPSPGTLRGMLVNITG